MKSHSKLREWELDQTEQLKKKLDLKESDDGSMMCYAWVLTDKTKTMNLTPKQALILSKFLDDKTKKDCREQITPGSYEDEFTVSVSGKIVVGEDYEAQNPIPWKKIALRLLSMVPAKEAVATVKESISEEDAPSVDQLQDKISLSGSSILGKSPRAGVVNSMAIVKVIEWRGA